MANGSISLTSARHESSPTQPSPTQPSSAQARPVHRTLGPPSLAAAPPHARGASNISTGVV
ncbi:hypothetical protein E2C01_094736 [Portunus trituberculatus]|uniref:Uncharacterized protein n=1 Tax=Portunus trituberculatus TaxID=210409 RepID=A0A5B7JWY2_PORTR|nr:hypothetical protein [Portunus trituberculatus]